MLAFLFTASFLTTFAYAKEAQVLTREEVLAMDKSELLTALQEEGLILPEDYAAHIEEMAENFVYQYTRKLINGEIDASYPCFNYDQSSELLSNLDSVLRNLGLVANKTSSTRTERLAGWHSFWRVLY